MNAVRYLIIVVVATAICAFGVLASDKSPSSRHDNAAEFNPEDKVRPVNVPTSQSREILDANPGIVRWLLEVTNSKDGRAAEVASQAMIQLAPFATAELMDELDNGNVQSRALAIGYLASSPSVSERHLLAKLLVIAKDEQEDKAVRSHATYAVCEIIRRIKS